MPLLAPARPPRVARRLRGRVDAVSCASRCATARLGTGGLSTANAESSPAVEDVGPRVALVMVWTTPAVVAQDRRRGRPLVGLSAQPEPGNPFVALAGRAANVFSDPAGAQRQLALDRLRPGRARPPAFTSVRPRPGQQLDQTVRRDQHAYARRAWDEHHDGPSLTSTQSPSIAHLFDSDSVGFRSACGPESIGGGWLLQFQVPGNDRHFQLFIGDTMALEDARPPRATYDDAHPGARGRVHAGEPGRLRHHLRRRPQRPRWHPTAWAHRSGHPQTRLAEWPTTVRTY
jgi:hypothetical protein